MIQFNLLPDVKIAYLKTQKTKRLVMVVSLALAALSIGIMTILFVTVQGVQKKSLSDVSKDIDKEMKTLNAVQDLDKILTIQNQLASLTSLHDQKPVSSRTFSYVATITPNGAKISHLTVDFATSTISISGTADSLVTVNKFADSVKFATYKTSTTENGKPFSAVVTTSSLDNTGKSSYSINFTFDPVLFANTETPTLTVPSIISNRSETEKPTAIFKEETPKKATN